MLMGGVLGKKHVSGGNGDQKAKGKEKSKPSVSNTDGNEQNEKINKTSILKPGNLATPLSEFNIMGLATNLSNRLSTLSGLSITPLLPITQSDSSHRPWSKLSRKRWHQSTLDSEYAQSKTVWPVAQTEALFLPEFPVGLEENLKLVLIGEISRGAFGQVFHVKCANSEKEFAMKVLSKSQVCSLDAVYQVKQEVLIQKMCSHHPFITPLSYYWQTRKLLIVMTEYIAYGELQQLWRSLGRLPESMLKIYVAEISLSLDFLHNAGIIYRDLKMENILLDAEGHIKLIDFGLAKWLKYGARTRTICGTLQFMAPEVLRGEDYGHSADWWSLGIITLSLLTGHYPVTGYDNHVSMSSAVDRYNFAAPVTSSSAVQSLICGLLQRNPSLRTHSLRQIEREELFQGFNFEMLREKKIFPRKILEAFIDDKAKINFEEFGGLTSTPKRGESHDPPIGSSASSFLHPSNGERPSWSQARRSISSPLLHPGRLGHHDALVKSVSASGHQGAAVPLLQSPLLRLARGHDIGNPPKRAKSQGSVSACALPTAVSPLLVNVRGNRKKVNAVSSVSKTNNDKQESLLTNINDYSKRLSEKHCISKALITATIENDDKINSLGDEDSELFKGLVTSTPKKESIMSKVYQNYKPNSGMGKPQLINGALLCSNNNFNPIDENDFDDECFDTFPWISQTLDT